MIDSHALRLWAPWLPHTLVILWLVLIGLTVWQHAQRSELPPIHDALTYFQKAQNFWNNFHQGTFVNPLNLDPVSRPPGTVLMSYPFGFNSDFRPFHFRSVYIPILCLIAALYVVGFSTPMSPPSHWNLAMMAIFFSTLPMFYHFELVEDSLSPGYWGLVDTFLAGVAGLAAAACARSIKESSLAWMVGGSVLAALCLLVKPSGALVMALVGAGWLGCSLLQLKRPGSVTAVNGNTKRLLISGLPLMGAIFASTLYLCFSSQYLSPHTLAFGQGAMHILQADWNPKITPEFLHSLVHTSFGYPFLVSLMLVLALAATSWKAFPLTIHGWTKYMLGSMIVMAVLVLTVGSWFWLAQTGVSQVRYFYPFAIMALIFSVPLILVTLEITSNGAKKVIRLLFLLPAINLCLLLGQQLPGETWQRLAGINLASGTSTLEIAQAKAFLHEIQKIGRNVQVYSLFSHRLDSIFTSVGGYEHLLYPSHPTYLIQRPVDWQRPTAYRIHDILASDYILFSPITDSSQKIRVLAQYSVETFAQERHLFHAWFTDLTADDGVTVVSESSGRLLKMTDSHRLEASLVKLEAAYDWRPSFLEENPPRWWSTYDLAEAFQGFAPLSTNISFGDSFTVHALSAARSQNFITIKAWWVPGGNHDLSNWMLFVHLLDSQGQIIARQEGPLAVRKPLSPERPIRLDVVTFPNTSYSNPSAIAFGIYRPAPSPAFLLANKGQRDWENRRVLVSLPNLLDDH